MIAATRWILRSSLVLIVPVTAAQQAPSRDNVAPPATTGTAVVSGVVVNDKSGQPVRRAVVTIANAEAGFRVTSVTDDTGTFSFKDLPPGRFFLGAGRPGFVSASFGAKRPNSPGSTIALTDGQRKTGVTLRLVPGGVITGTVRNRAGEPVPGVRVIVLHLIYGYDTGERQLSSSRGGFGEATDDRGVYRVFGLPPDEYFVVVSPGIGISRSGSDMREITAPEMDWAMRQLRGSGAATAMSPQTAPATGRAVDYAPVFYPGVFTQAAAASVKLKAGEERSGVDISLEMTPTAKVTGKVVSMDGELPANLQVNVVAHDTISGIPFSGFGSARVDKDGKFVSAGLSPGDYTITVRVGGAAGRGGAAGSAATTRFGLTTVSINGQDIEATVTLESGVTVSGHLVFDGTTATPPADLTKVRVSLTAVRSSTPTLGVPAVSADATGAFTFVGVTPGRYRLSAFGAAGAWQLRSATLQGHDTLDTPFEVRNQDISGAELTFTDRPAELSGDLRDAAGQPAPEYFIIVFPSDRTYWTPQSRRIQSVRPGNDGHYRVENLPAGEYFIAAVTDVEQGEWYDPSFLAQLVGASTKITLAEGEKKVQSLKLGGGSE